LHVEYESPTLDVLGKVAELTQVCNKIGGPADDYTAVTGGVIVGSVTCPPGL
jgi:hypothetical protein